MVDKDVNNKIKEAVERSAEYMPKPSQGEPEAERRKSGHPLLAGIKWVLLALLLGILMLASRAIWWGIDGWSELTTDEIIYHLKSPLEGTSTGMWVQFFVLCVLFAIAAIVLFLLLIWLTRNSRLWRRIVLILFPLLILGYFAYSLYAGWTQFSVGDYIRGQTTTSSFIDDNYADPKEVSITFPEKKRNLIYIYLESMEVTSTAKEFGGNQEENYIPELTKIAQENECFSGDDTMLDGAFSLYNTTWTMGGIYGQSAGLPLTLSIDGSSMNSQESFFPGVTAIGDILQEEGYRNAFMCGSIASFGGRELFFQTHGNYEILDYSYSIHNGEIPEDYYVWWGYEDEKLFEHAKTHLQEMSKQDQPFNLTMLTVDTHFEDGYFCEDCEESFEDQYFNVINCTSRRVEEFLEWIRQQDFYENTTVVLVGDHPTMDADFKDHLSEDYERKVYVSYINADAENEKQEYRTFSTFDLFPTTIAALGATIEGDRLALGTNLFSGKQTLTEQWGREYEDVELSRRSDLIDTLMTVDESLEPVVEVEPETLENGAEGYRIRITNVPESEDFDYVSFAMWQKDDFENKVWLTGAHEEDRSYTAFLLKQDLPKGPDTYTISVRINYKNGSSGPLTTVNHVFE